MDKADLQEFARRDWAAVAESKALYWIEMKRGMDASAALAVGDLLRRHVLAVREDWPSASERAEDLSTHSRVAVALARVPSRSRR